MKELNQTFLIRVNQIMSKKGLSQYKLEKLTGISHSTLTKILNNTTHNTSFKKIVKIINALGYTLSDFFNNDIFKLENINLD